MDHMQCVKKRLTVAEEAIMSFKALLYALHVIEQLVIAEREVRLFLL